MGRKAKYSKELKLESVVKRFPRLLNNNPLGRIISGGF